MLKNINSDIENKIVRYLNHMASASDLDFLKNWIEDSSSRELFIKHAQVHFAINVVMINPEAKKAIHRQLLSAIRKEKSKVIKTKRKIFFSYAVAACFLILFGTFIHLNIQNEIYNEINNKTIEAGTDKAIVTLNNGTAIVLKEDTKYQNENIFSNGKQIVYKAVEKRKPKIKVDAPTLEYNYLNIPRGGQFQIVLSDNTVIWLNSESLLKYPENFIKGQAREVELIYGEAYFDVAPSLDHNGDVFKIKTGIQMIEVTGTEFNIKAYKDEEDIVSTLVEGHVKVHNDTHSIELKPFEQSMIKKTEKGKIKLHKVDKLFDQIAWKEGYFSFKQETMEEIMNILSKWYDVEYEFKNPEVMNKSFSGILERGQSINHILSQLQKTNEISFKVDKRTIIIQ